MKREKTFFWLFLLLFLSFTFPLFGQKIPRPEDVLGFPVGADYHLATYNQAIAYLKKLAENTDRIKLFDVGKTSMGQTMTYAVISSAENLANLEKYKQIARRLSLVKGTSPEEAARLAAEGRAIVYIDGGLHASECAPAQHNIQLAYELVSDEDSRTQKIRENVILILVFANPDGMNLLADWYHPNVGTPYEVSPLPWLYHKYAGHDNNRDSYIANLIETQNISRLVFQEWFPVILYNHHQTAPFPARIWIPPNSEPTNPNVHPLLVRWQNLIGSAMGAAFDAEGKEGAISRIVFDTWYPGYVTQVVDSHNIISILTETALYRYATPRFYTVRDFPKEYQDLTMSAFYPSPWKGGWWRLKDAVDYCLTASKAVLEVAAKFREKLLFNKYRMGRDIIERFRKEPPYAWIIPQQQADPPTMALLLNRMILLGIDVYRAEQAFTGDSITYPAGTLVIPMTQANALFIKNVFEEQRYPDLRKYPDLWQGLIQSKKFEGAPFESYDMMGWTLPYQFGIKVQAAQTPLPDIPLTQLKEVIPLTGGLKGGHGEVYLLKPEPNLSFTAAIRLMKAGADVSRAKKAFTVEGETFPAGTFIISPGRGKRQMLEKQAKELHLDFVGIAGKPKVESWSMKIPRVGIYQSWVPSADEGWTRFILEQYEIPYTVLHDADIRAGNLAGQFDAIVIPDHSVEAVVEGHAKGTMPPQYVGGLSAQGVRNLKLYVEAGGTLIFLNSISDLALEHLGVPARNILKNIKPEEFVCSASILRLEYDADHPLTFGLAKEGGAVFSDSLAFDVFPSFDGKMEAKPVARYASENLLMSGFLHGEKLIQRKPAILEVTSGQGRMILFGVPVQFRGQSYGNFKLLFNALFLAAAK